MGLLLRRVATTCATGLAVALAACQGGGGTGGLSLPPTSQYGNPNGPSSAQSTSRQQVLEGTVAVGSQLAELPLPSVAGFAVTISLGATPRPESSAFASASASPSQAEPSASPAPSPSPVPSASDSAAPEPSPSGSGSPKTTVKTTIYPDDAPAAPTPAPAASGEPVALVKRVALVRGFVQTAADLPLYGLGAVRFTIPATEQSAGRGFTIAAFQPGKKHHDVSLASDTAATIAADTVTSTARTPLVLKKGTAYLFVLYGDELPATPGPATGSYPGTANNPFPTPTPTAFPGIPSSPNPYGSANPYSTPH